MPLLNRLIPAVYNALLSEPAPTPTYIPSSRNTRRYFEESGAGLRGAPPAGLESEAQIRSKIGAPYQHLVAQLIDQTAMVGNPTDDFSLRGRMYVSSDPKVFNKLAEEGMAKYLAEGESIPKGKRFFGIGRNANPQVYAHEMRHVDLGELSNRVADLMYAGSEPAYREALRNLYSFALLASDEYKKLPFKERVKLRYEDSPKEQEKYIFEKLKDQFNYQFGRNADPYSREKKYSEENFKLNLALNKSGARGAFDKTGKQIQKELLEQRAKYPFLNFAGRVE
jgi:hypothetical protein